MTVVREILLRAVKQAFNFPEERVQIDVLKYALDSYNHFGQVVWNEWRWDNAKIEEKEYTPDADGIITLDADVESVRAVYSGTDAAGAPVFPLDESLKFGGAAPALTTETFHHMADDEDTGQRRIKVTKATATYRILALKRFVEATIESDYDEEDPSATPTDYRVAQWILDRAKPAIVSLVADALRKMRGLSEIGDGAAFLQKAIQREETAQAKDNRVVPQFPLYGEVGNWY